MKHKVSVNRLLGIVVAAGLLVAACSPAATAPPPTAAPTTAPPLAPTLAPTSAPTAVPATATTATTATAVLTAAPTVEPTSSIVFVGTDIKQILPPGDAARGEQLVNEHECAGCHLSEVLEVNFFVPTWRAAESNDYKGIATRAETRYLAAEYTGHATSAQEYLFESIMSPNAYIIAEPPPNGTRYEFSAGISTMPSKVAASFTAQMLADVIAFLETLK
jgi:hypothetical protein